MSSDATDRDSGPLIDIGLPDGRSIWCWQYVVSSTRVGVEVVRRTEEWNEEMKQATLGEVAALFGPIPTLFIEPSTMPRGDGRPRVRVTALFRSGPIGETATNSSLVIAWIQNRQAASDAEALSGLREIEWDRWAADETETA